MAAGRPRRREFEYVRHGTASLLAAMDVHSGKVLARPIEKNNSTTFCAFLDIIDAAVDADLTVHVILDNGSSYVSKETRTWFVDHPRWVVHYTPVHASWVNQIELFFSILQRKVVRNGNLHLAGGPHPQAARLHQRLRPDSQAVRLDLGDPLKVA